jgi:hypothetical protein
MYGFENDNELNYVLALSASEAEARCCSSAGDSVALSAAESVSAASDTKEQLGTHDGEDSGQSASSTGQQRRRARRADTASDAKATPRGLTRKQEKVNAKYDEYITAYAAKVDQWRAVISDRAAQRREDEERQAPHRWGTSQSELQQMLERHGSVVARWKLWLDLDVSATSAGQVALRWLGLMAHISQPEQLRGWTHGYHTCLNEAFNNARTRLTPKSASMWASFEQRSKLVAMQWNACWTDVVCDLARRLRVDLEPYQIQRLQKMDEAADRLAHRRQQTDARVRQKKAELAKEVDRVRKNEHTRRAQQKAGRQPKPRRSAKPRPAADDATAAAADEGDGITLSQSTQHSRLSQSQSLSNADDYATEPRMSSASSASRSSIPASSQPGPLLARRRSSTLSYKTAEQKRLPVPFSAEGEDKEESRRKPGSKRQARRDSAGKENEVDRGGGGLSGSEPMEGKGAEVVKRARIDKRGRALRERN